MFGIPATAGERLRAYLGRDLLGPVDWDSLATALIVTGRGEAYADYVRRFAATHLASRLILTAQGLAGLAPNPVLPTSDARFTTAWQRYLAEDSDIPVDHQDEVFRLTVNAVDASRDKVSPGQKNQFRRWARDSHPNCYICGAVLDFTSTRPEETPAQKAVKYQLDHVWPQHLGGDSDKSNLLPSCAKCNNERKGDLASWTSPAVLSLAVRPSPSFSSLNSMDGRIRFGLLYRAVIGYADRENLTLKEAFLAIGPWTDTRVLNSVDATDFFNVETHAPPDFA